VPFPGTLFNKTVEANYAEIQGWIGGLRRRWNALLDALAIGPLGGVRRGVGRALGGRFGVWIFLGLSALVYGFLSPSFGLDLNSLALFAGMLVGLALITAAFDLPLRFYHRRRSAQHDAGVLRALWWTLGIALVCVVISRLANFQPGYLYGLVVSIVFVTEISTREEGIGTWLASLWLLGLSVVAWVAARRRTPAIGRSAAIAVPPDGARDVRCRRHRSTRDRPAADALPARPPALQVAAQHVVPIVRARDPGLPADPGRCGQRISV